jgi:adenylate cyclase
MASPQHPWRKAAILALVIALLGPMLCLAPWGFALEESLGLDNLFRLRGERPAPPDVAIVAIDREAAAELGLPNRPEQWPRRYHAQLLDALSRQGAAVVVFDLLFATARGDDDALFAQSLARANNVVLFERLEGGAVGAGRAWLETRLPPLPLFAGAARGLAPFPLPKIPTQVRAYWTFKPGAGDVPTIPLVALHLTAQQRWPEAFPSGPTAGEGPRWQSLRSEVLARHTHEHTPLHAPTDLARIVDAYRGDSRYLNFYGPPRSITTLRYHAVLHNGDVLDLRGKIVFVGLSEPHLQAQDDGYVTVFSRADGVDLPGVEIAATAFANLLYGETIEPPSAQHTLLALISIGAVLGVLCMLLSPLWAGITVLTLATLYTWLAYRGFVIEQQWWPLAVPLLGQLPVAYFGALAWRYADSMKARRALTQAVGYYLPSDAVKTLLGGPANIAAGGRLLQGVCLCTDAQHYTDLSENLPPDELSDVINAYYATLFAPVRQRGGVISDVVGDSMLALWTNPADRADTRAHACHAAIDISNALAQQLAEGQRRALPTRIGLHCGEILLGNVGALDHFEYRAVGDTVNTASRIQGLNKHLGTWILASAAVLRDLSHIPTRPLGAFLLVGKRKPLHLHELLSNEHVADATAKTLYAHFATALAAFQAGNWQQARALFDAIVARHPQDGPSRYFANLCHDYLLAPPEDWRGVVTLQAK